MATEGLEASLKATLSSLSLILSFYSSVQSLGVSAYAPSAPRQLTQQLMVDKFDDECAQIERRVLRAIAVLERDARKKKGELPLASTASIVVPTAQVGDDTLFDPTSGTANAAPFPFTFSDASGLGSGPAPIEVDAGMDMDDVLGGDDGDSLFGDGSMGTTPVDSSEVTASTESFMAALTDTSGLDLSSALASAPPPDLLASFPLPSAPISSGTTLSLSTLGTLGVGAGTAPGDDFSMSGMGFTTAPQGDFDLGDIDIGMDGADIGMDSAALDEFLKSIA